MNRFNVSNKSNVCSWFIENNDEGVVGERCNIIDTPRMYNHAYISHVNLSGNAILRDNAFIIGEHGRSIVVTDNAHIGGKVLLATPCHIGGEANIFSNKDIVIMIHNRKIITAYNSRTEKYTRAFNIEMNVDGVDIDLNAYGGTDYLKYTDTERYIFDAMIDILIQDRE